MGFALFLRCNSLNSTLPTVLARRIDAREALERSSEKKKLMLLDSPTTPQLLNEFCTSHREVFAVEPVAVGLLKPVDSLMTFGASTVSKSSRVNGEIPHMLRLCPPIPAFVNEAWCAIVRAL